MNLYIARMREIEMRVEAKKGYLDGMRSDDERRIANGFAPAWGGTCFFEVSDEITKLADEYKSCYEELNKLGLLSTP